MSAQTPSKYTILDYPEKSLLKPRKNNIPTITDPLNANSSLFPILSLFDSLHVIG